MRNTRAINSTGNHGLADKEHGALSEPNDLFRLATDHNPLKGASADRPNDYAIHTFPLCYLYDYLMWFIATYNPPLAPDALL